VEKGRKEDRKVVRTKREKREKEKRKIQVGTEKRRRRNGERGGVGGQKVGISEKQKIRKKGRNERRRVNG
jgi:hypothetical protein